MKEKPNWDGSTPVYSETHERVFCNIGDIADEYSDSLPEGVDFYGIPPDEYLDSLKLFHTRPRKPTMLDIEYLCYDLPENNDMEDELTTFIDELNKQVAECFARHGIIEDSGVRAIYGTGGEGGEL